MKILYISKYASYNPYGMDTRHIYLSRELVKKGNDVTLYLSDSNHQLKKLPIDYSQNIDGINVRWIKTTKYQKAYGIRRILSWFNFEVKLRKELKKHTNVDLVIISSLSLLSIFNGIYIKKKHKSKLVFEIRDIWPLVLRRISSITRINPFYQFLSFAEKKGYKEADLIVGTMPNLESHVSSTINQKKKVIWIPHLINPNLNYLETHSHREELKAFRMNFKFVVCYAGSINRSSSIELLLKSAVSESMESIGFAILGDGPLLDELRLKYSSKNIQFFDKIPQEEVVSFLNECDILYDGYLKSDIYKFGNSRNKYVEYCLAAKPVLIGYSGFPLFFDEEQCGIIVEPESVEAIIKGIQLLVNKDQMDLDKMGENAHRFATNYLNVSVQTEKLLDAIAV
ncbi:MAG: glycosyltransferase family 4 protein [Bacteroidia bacterium]|nr:glycosyltransferase family 4 protein [Bacteroidia bacterium]NNJ54966.1 glycosyltransferase family 4 protein [Bacteroidia bacterium]